MENEIVEIEETKQLRAHSTGGLLQKDIEVILNSLGRSWNDPGTKFLRNEEGLLRQLQTTTRRKGSE